MAHVFKVPPIPSSDALLAILNDESREYLHLLEDMRTEINVMVSAVGTIKEIDSLVVKGRSDREQAARELAIIQAKALEDAEWLAGERAKLAKRSGDLTRRDRDGKSQLKQSLVAYDQSVSAVTAREAAVSEREGAIGDAEAKAESRRGAANASKRRFDKGWGEIQAVVNGMG